MDERSPTTCSTDAQTAVKRGQSILKQLSLQAQAARIEAKRAELELLVDQAHHGSPHALQSWLERNAEVIAGNVSEESVSTVTETRVAALTPVDWSGFQRAARARLAERLQQRPLVPNIERKQPTHSHADCETSLAELAAPEAASTSHVVVEPLFEVASGSDATEVSKPTFASDQPAELVAGLDLTAGETSAVHVKKPRWRGVVVSAVFHAALLIALGVVTIDSPVKDGLLSLVASEASAETSVESFELQNDLEVHEPTEMVQPAEPTTQPNLSEVLPGFDQSVTEAISESLGATASAPASSAQALAVRSAAAKAAMSFYGAESSGNSFCFVVDGSGSMRGGPWEAARAELLRSIGALKPNQRFYIIFFNKEINAIPEPGSNQPARNALTATPENMAHAKRWLDTLQITTGEPPQKALQAALKIECDCIYFLADGEMSDNSFNKLMGALRKDNRADDLIDGEVVLVPIHAIAYYSDKGIAKMKQIAEENRGQFAYVPKPPSSRGSK